VLLFRLDALAPFLHGLEATIPHISIGPLFHSSRQCLAACSLLLYPWGVAAAAPDPSGVATDDSSPV
jgi:hypothetical protein